MGGLFARREPFDDETLEGYMIRLCEANSIPTMRWLLDEVADRRFSTLDRGVAGVVTSGHAVSSLEALAELAPRTLEPYAYRGGYWGESEVVGRGLFRWPTPAMAIEHHQVCPACLQEANYHRAAWSYYHAPVCTIHHRTLVDQCPACHKPIRCSRTEVSRCGSCGADYRSAEGDSVPEHVVEFATRIQDPHMLALGSGAYTEPVTPDEVFRLWCLAHIPKLGESLDVTTAFKAAKLPAARRVGALTALADAWRDRRLDSGHLRQHIGKRWAHFNALPHDSLQDSQIRTACWRLRLNRRIAHVLLHDDAPSPLRDSLVAFGTQPPQLKSREDVADFLEVPVAAVEPLCGWSGILTDPTHGRGFDADEVLEAKRFLDGMLTAWEVDQALGVEGAVAELEYLKLLAPWPGLEHHQARYPARTLAQLFDQIFESIVPTDTTSSVTCLQDCLVEPTDPGTFVSAIGLILNGGLQAYGWGPPFRLTDLRVNAAEVSHALVESRA